LIAGFRKVLIDVAFCLTKSGFKHQVIFEIVLSANGMQVIDMGLLIVLVKMIHFDVPGRFVFVGPHIREAQRTRISIVEIRPGLSALIGARHKAPVRGQQGLPGWLNITRARPRGSIFEFCCRFIQAYPAFIAGPVFIIGFVAFRKGNFVRVRAVAIFSHFNRRKGSNIKAEHIGGIAGLEIKVRVPGSMRKVNFVLIFISDIFTVTFTLPVIDTASEG
jgi:hypothetical protein